MNGENKRVLALVGVGFDQEDGHIRWTRGNGFEVVMGSEKSHEFLSSWIRRIERRVESQGRSIQELTPDELLDIIHSV